MIQPDYDGSLEQAHALIYLAQTKIPAERVAKEIEIGEARFVQAETGDSRVINVGLYNVRIVCETTDMYGDVFLEVLQGELIMSNRELVKESQLKFWP